MSTVIPFDDIWREIAPSSVRERAWAPNAAGVASARKVVVTSPVLIPRAIATSVTLCLGSPSAPTPTAPMYERSPVA